MVKEISVKEDKAMKRFIVITALAAIAMTACNKDLNKEELQPGKDVAFTATTESPATKTALNKNDSNYEVVWQSGDQITVVDAASNVGVYSTTSTTTKGDFTFESGTEATTAPYTAYYPAEIYNSGTPTLPATQNYVEGNISGSPMYAESSTESLAFKNICGIIRLNVSTTQTGKKVRKIVLKATQGMSGAFTLSSNVASVTGTEGVTLDCGASGVEIGSTAKPFHIAVPQNTYTSLSITVVTTDGEVQARTSNTGIAVNRSSITDITLGFGSLASTTGSATINGGSTQGWVQLWAGGPKWAKFNVGSTINSYAGVTEYTIPDVTGGHYSFKGRYDSTPDAEGTDDTANYLWGIEWSTPTKEQEQALLDNCTWEFCDGSTVQYEPGCTLKGWKVSGKDAGYTENSIFLPYSGINDQNYYGVSKVGERGVYWSSTAVGSDAYYLNEGQYGEKVMDHNKPHGCSVRAIYVGDVYTDLSETEAANCYLVPAAGMYKFKATVKGNGAADLSGISKDTDPADISTASLVWATFNTAVAPVDGELIKDIKYSNGYVYFSTGDTYKEGNALIAIKDASDKILWSWHLWFETDNLVSLAQTYPTSGYVVMDRNLGALTNCYAADNALDFGFAYQHGRKDPFMMTASRTSHTQLGVLGTYTSSDGSSTVASSIERPTVVFGTDSWGGNSDLWSAASKTIFDPCPPGWHIAPGNLVSGQWSLFTIPDNDWSTYHGLMFNGVAWYPATGDRWGASHNNTGTTLRVWADISGCDIASDNGSTPHRDVSNPGHGYNVRCVRQ